MSLFVTSLNSGSNGNCYYIGNGDEAVLIDAGISCRETEKRMKRLGIDMKMIKAIFISHEHGDHICGLEALCAKYPVQVFITAATLHNTNLRIDKSRVHSFAADEPITIGELSVFPFRKQHDAADPHSFVVSGNEVSIGVFTDIGVPCEHVTRNFKKCTAVFLEANYDDDMLENGRYPQHLKRRISSNHGHLSNRQALDLFVQHKPPFMTHVYLSHLSKDNNSPELVRALFSSHAGQTQIAIASRDREIPICHITSNGRQRIIRPVAESYAEQLSLF